MQAGNANQREATEYNNSHRTSHKTDTLPQVAESAGAVNGQDERAAPAVDSPACPCWWVVKGRQQGVLPPLTIIRERGIFHDRERIQRTYPVHP